MKTCHAWKNKKLFSYITSTQLKALSEIIYFLAISPFATVFSEFCSSFLNQIKDKSDTYYGKYYRHCGTKIKEEWETPRDTFM